MPIDFLLDGFRTHGSNDAIVWRDRTFSYGWLLEAVKSGREYLNVEAIGPGTVVSLEGDFSPRAIALLLALIQHACIIVPLTPSVEAKKKEFRHIASVEAVIHLTNDDTPRTQRTGATVTHDLLLALRAQQRPGLILFSSGSTGASKAALHDFVPLLDKFRTPRRSSRAITFLLFDHIGGVNTLLYVLSNGGCVVTLQDRSPAAVCQAIEKHRVQLLPASPTFLNLLLLSEAYREHDLSSLDTITYGTEVMPESTLATFHQRFPHIRLQQTYGLSEVGILRSKSRASDSLWMKIGGDGFETRVVNGLLEIRARSAMLGYLNAPSPLTEDGWLRTGDAVHVDGDYLRILGRASEIINVGGEKVYPAEVESVIQSMDGVADVAVSGESNALTGQLVRADVKLTTSETLSDFRSRMRRFCQGRLPAFKIPQKVVIASHALHGDRFKKIRPV